MRLPDSDYDDSVTRVKQKNVLPMESGFATCAGVTTECPPPPVLPEITVEEKRRDFWCRMKEWGLEFPMEPHPVWKCPYTEDSFLKCWPFGENTKPQFVAASKWLVKRSNEMAMAEGEPLMYGLNGTAQPVMDLVNWAKADALWKNNDTLVILGGWASGKTFYGARSLMVKLLERENQDVLSMHESLEASVASQQRAVQYYMPAVYRSWDNRKRNPNFNVSYNLKNGYTDSKFVFPGKRTWMFKNYTQDIRTVQGVRFNVIWCDENITPDWYETLDGRTWGREGSKRLFTFTPILGFTPAVTAMLSGATVEEWQPASLLPQDEVLLKMIPGAPKGCMPWVLKGGRAGLAIICFASDRNPFNDVAQLKRSLHGQTRELIMLRVYGWPVNRVGVACPKFNEKVHVVKASDIPKIGEGTDYQVVDPSSTRNSFALWARVVRVGEKRKIFVHREWPDKSMGEWALPGDKPDGKEGPAQREGAPRSFSEQKRIFRELEGAEKIYLRFMDARTAAVQATGYQGGTSVIDLFANDEREILDGREVVTPGMYFEPVKNTRTDDGREIETGLAILNDWLDYRVGEAVTAANEPEIFISEDCVNTIYSLKTWTGADGQKGASKDPMDCLRQMAAMDIEHVTSEMQKGHEGGSY